MSFLPEPSRTYIKKFKYSNLLELNENKTPVKWTYLGESVHFILNI